MSDTSGIGEPFIFTVPVMRMRRNIALAYVAFSLLMALIIPYKLGFSRFYHVLRSQPAAWVVCLILAAGIALFLRLAFPPRATRPRLEINHDGIRYIPGKIERLGGEPAGEAPISPQSSEIILTRNLVGGVSDGYRLIVSAAGKVEHEIKIDFSTYIDPQQAQQIADGITSTIGLPVRLIQRLRSMEGTVKEISWVPTERKTNLKLTSMMTLGFLPYIGGAIAGYFVAEPTLIVMIGLVLWLGELLVLSSLDKRKSTRRKGFYLLTTIFTFGAAYAATATFVSIALRHR